MLIESACSVDRVEETLSTLLPMLPDVQYFRFNPGKVLVEAFIPGCSKDKEADLCFLQNI